MAIVLDHKVRIGPGHSKPHRRSRADHRHASASRKPTTWRWCCAPARCPASIEYLEERTVGPSLGADSIRHGVQASMVSLLVVLIFMVFYYRLSGVNAVVALLLNLVILLAALAYFGAVLTLPGIAGVILTIGMGVDSNVLIFERIREELRAGKAPASAVDLGFKRALSDDYRHARDHRGVGRFSCSSSAPARCEALRSP